MTALLSERAFVARLSPAEQVNYYETPRWQRPLFRAIWLGCRRLARALRYCANTHGRTRAYLEAWSREIGAEEQRAYEEQAARIACPRPPLIDRYEWDGALRYVHLRMEWNAARGEYDVREIPEPDLGMPNPN